MKKWLLPGVLVLLCLSGCCARPGVFQQVQRSLYTVQEFYGPLLKDGWEGDEKRRAAVVAADTTLLLAGELQKQWCPDAGQARQLELQAREAVKQAREAGVPETGADPGR